MDGSVRKTVYSSVLEQLESPKQLTMAQRELIVKAGLRDREMAVRNAAAKLVESWADLLGGDMLQFIKLFDFNLLETSENAAEHAVLSLLTTRPELMDGLDFSGEQRNEPLDSMLR